MPIFTHLPKDERMCSKKVFFDNDSFSMDILSAISLSEDLHLPTAKRDFCVLLFAASGSASISYGKDTLALNTGDTVYIPSEQPFGIDTYDGARIIAVHFSSDVAPAKDVKKLAQNETAQLSESFSQLLRIWSSREYGYGLRCRAILYGILFVLNGTDAPSDDKISEAEKYIRENFKDAELNVDALAASCGMSDTYFRRLFTERYGVTPLKYINKLRLALARELLESKYYSVGEVASACGFSNINYFSTFIKKELGTSPKKL